jgi:CPA1 family monovalent cation:H+ antiporter
VVTVVPSILIGLLLGGIAAWIGGRLDVNLELTLTIIAYGVYFVADRFHQSASSPPSWPASSSATTAEVRDVGALEGRHRHGLELHRVVLTAIVFLLIGLTITPDGLIEAAAPIAWAVGAILVGRAIVVYGLLGGLGRTRFGERAGLRFPTAWSHVLFWAGLRGAIAVALALSLPSEMPDRGLLQGIVFGIVLFTLLVQGTTAGWLLRRTGLGGSSEVAASSGPV